MLIDSTADADSKALKQKTRARRRWHAVMVVPRGEGCAASQACRNKRFLASEAPRLPLEGCDAASCGCRYRHYDDRRGPPRRQDDAAAAVTARSERNRRTRAGRRATDV